MLKKSVVLLFGLMTAFLFGCHSNRLTTAPGGQNVPADEYALKYWQDIARPVPVFQKTLIDKTSAESEELFARYTALFYKYAPYLIDEYNAVDKALNWPQGTYLKRTYWPLDGKAMYSKKGHECTSWAVLPDLAAENQLLLHKNRDTSIRKSVIVHRTSSERYGYIGLCDIGWFDITMGMNTVGLAVAMNSGDKSDGVSSCGMDTTLLGRIVLENCKTADEAVAMLEDMIVNKAYMHGNSGSIWLIADKDCVYVIENDAARFCAKKYESGLVVRANGWSFPDMLPFSQKSSQYLMDSRRREFAVTAAIFDNGTKYNRPATAELMAKAARVTAIPGYPEAYGTCENRTVSGATFSIDREFPADLSTVYAAVGNPDYTFFIPIPLTVNKIPDVLLNQKFSECVYKNLAAGKKIMTDEKRNEIENRINKIHRTARENARKILQNCFSDIARIEARKIMNDAFNENWKIISQYVK